MIAAEEQAARAYGSGPGAVRFISGTYDAARRARAAARRLPRPRGGDDLQLRLRHRAVDDRAADHRPDGADQRRAQPQLHHQRHAPGAAGAQGGLPPHRRRRPRAPAARRAPAAAGGRSWSPTASSRMRGDHAPLPEIVGGGEEARRPLPRERGAGGRRLHGVGAFGADRPRHRGVHRLRAGRRPGRHPRQGVRRQRRLRGGQRDADRLPARDVADVHLLEPDHARRGGGGAAPRSRSLDSDARPRAARPPAGDDGALRAGPRAPRLRDHPRRAPGGAADGARHRAHDGPGAPPQGATASSPPASSTRWCPRATRRSASRSPPTTPRPTSTRRSPCWRASAASAGSGWSRPRPGPRWPGRSTRSTACGSGPSSRSSRAAVPGRPWSPG